MIIIRVFYLNYSKVYYLFPNDDLLPIGKNL